MRKYMHSVETNESLIINILVYELYIANSMRLAALLMNLIENTDKDRIVIDFKIVSYIDSSFLSTLLKIMNIVSNRNQKLILTSVNENIYNILKITDMVKYIDVRKLDEVFSLV